jgi:hypothetical protein
VKAQIMNAKKYFVAAIVLSTVLLAFAASYFLRPTHRGDNETGPALTGPSGKFGPVIDTVVPTADNNGTADILDLETDRSRIQPPWAHFNYRVDAIMGWIRSNGLDISSFVLSGGAACITYDMTIVPVERKCWEETTSEELRDNPALAPRPHSPRRLLVVGDNRPDTYIFRTGEGTLGMLRIVGLSQNGQGVKIRYKLINPASMVSTVSAR